MQLGNRLYAKHSSVKKPKSMNKSSKLLSLSVKQDNGQGAQVKQLVHHAKVYFYHWI